jgi:hypothetical protein
MSGDVQGMPRTTRNRPANEETARTDPGSAGGLRRADAYCVRSRGTARDGAYDGVACSACPSPPLCRPVRSFVHHCAAGTPSRAKHLAAHQGQRAGARRGEVQGGLGVCQEGTSST